MRIFNRLFVAVCYLLLAGCATTTSIGSIAGGECRLTHTPEFVVLGRQSYDQAWINRTIEAQVRGCRQARPKARPAHLDAQQIGQAKAIIQQLPKQERSRLRRWLGV